MGYEMAYAVFLSHNSRDGEWIKWIGGNAQSAGISVWLYEHDPRPGVLIADKVKEKIRACDALVVLLTENSRSSAYVQQEIGFAEACGKLIIPLVQPGIEPGALAMLEGREWVEFDFKNPERALAVLLDYLQRLKAAKETRQRAALVGFGTLLLVAFMLRE